MSYAQVIPNMWITCGLAVDELGMAGGFGQKKKIFHIYTKIRKSGGKKELLLI